MSKCPEFPKQFRIAYVNNGGRHIRFVTFCIRIRYSKKIECLSCRVERRDKAEVGLSECLQKRALFYVTF